MNMNQQATKVNSPATVYGLIEEAKKDGSLFRTQKRMLLATRLKSELKCLKMSGNEFADKMNKKPSEISKWLSGTHNFTLDTLTDIESVLNINIVNVETPVKGIKIGVRNYTMPFQNVDSLAQKPIILEAAERSRY